MKNILATILITFAVQVLSETNTEVIESFAQIFEKLHQDINDFQAVTHSLGQQIAYRLAATVHKVEGLLIQDQNEAISLLHKELQEMLERLNLSPNNDDVKKCIAASDNDVDNMILRSQGGLQVCKTTNADQTDKANIRLNEVYGKQAKEHRDLDGTKLQCNSTARDPAQLRNCLYYQLFVVHIDLIKELKEESGQVINNYESVFDNVGNELLQCSNVVKRNILNEVNEIVLKFHNCCYDILGV